MINHAVLSVDLEFFTDTFAFQKLSRKWEYGEAGEAGVEKLLKLFEKHNIKSTFFVVSGHVESHKQLLNRIRNGGHEIASHTMTHRSLLNLTDMEILSEVCDSKKMLEDAISAEVLGFRAPAFGINTKIATAIEQSGYQYDSSVVPCLRIPGWYGFPRAPKQPFTIRELFPTVNSDLMEFPIAVNPVIRMPISGAWMRIFGIRYTMWGIKSLLRRGIVPVLHVHPWELVYLPRLRGIPWRAYYHTGAHTFKMIEQIITGVGATFITIRSLLEMNSLKGAGL